MKIAYLSKPFFADVDLCYLNEAQKNIDITYFLTLTPASKKATAINIEQLYPQTGIFKASIYPQLQSLYRFVDPNRFFVINLPQKGWHPSTWVTYLKLFRLFKRNFDLIHTTLFFPYFALYFYFLKRKMLVTMHDPFSHSNVTSKMALFERKNALRFFHNFLLLNKTQSQDFFNKYLVNKPNRRVFLSSLSCYNYLRLFESPRVINGEYIVFWGRICSYKGLEYLFPAMEKVHEVCPNIKLVVAGSGSYYFDISKYKKLDYFEILNRFIPDSELASLINYSLFAVVPYNDATQSGVIMSAYAFGKPCVATDVGGLPEVVINEKNGLIVPSRDSNKLAEAIIALLNDRNKLDKFSKEIHSEYFEGAKSWKRIAKDMKEMYFEISKCK